MAALLLSSPTLIGGLLSPLRAWAVASGGERAPSCAADLRHLRPPYRHGLHAEDLGGLNSAVARDDLPVVVDKHRVAEAKPLDALGDLADLLFGVCSCIALIWPERFDRLDAHAVSP